MRMLQLVRLLPYLIGVQGFLFRQVRRLQSNVYMFESHGAIFDQYRSTYYAALLGASLCISS
jgi:hypothetical protein